jgi:hypothetical protein
LRRGRRLRRSRWSARKTWRSRREPLSSRDVRSTIPAFLLEQKRPRGRVTISTTHSHLIQAQSTTERYAVSAQMTFGTDRLAERGEGRFAPSRSARRRVTQSDRPARAYHDHQCRLRPSTFFPGVVAAGPALFGSFDGLAIEHRSARPGRLHASFRRRGRRSLRADAPGPRPLADSAEPWNTMPNRRKPCGTNAGKKSARPQAALGC